MTATFLLPFAMGACASVGGNIVMDAFGVVAMVAMTPLITIQILGLIHKLQAKKSKVSGDLNDVKESLELIGDYDIVEL